MNSDHTHSTPSQRSASAQPTLRQRSAAASFGMCRKLDFKLHFHLSRNTGYTFSFICRRKQNRKSYFLCSFWGIWKSEFWSYVNLRLFLKFKLDFRLLRNDNFRSSFRRGEKMGKKTKFRSLFSSALKSELNIYFRSELKFGLKYLFKLPFKWHLKV